jgi:arylsulfatase
VRAGLVLAVLGAVGVGIRLGRERACADFNVVMIVLDAAGARYFGSYGNELPTTPNLDAFAAGGTLFERAYSQSPATVMSIGSVMSGKYPPTYFDPKKPFNLANEETLPEVLQRAGFRTAAFSQNPWVSPKFGFGGGFDEFHLDRELSMTEPRDPDKRGVPDMEMVSDVAAWIRRAADDRFFLFVHLLPPHAPYTPPLPFAGKFDPNWDGPRGALRTPIDLVSGKADLAAGELDTLLYAYQENLAFADSLAATILDQLSSSEVLDHSLVVVTADHGEAFMEHGWLSHGTSLYDEMLHVPLLIRWPACLGSFPSRWSNTVELRRLFATISDAAGLDGGDRTDSILAMLRGEAPPGDRLVRADVFTPARDRLRSVIVWPDKLIAWESGKVELYDLEADPRETTNLAASRPEAVARLRAELDEQRPEIVLGEKADLGDGTRDRLRALGYDVE